MESGKWRVESGKRRVESGKRRAESGKMRAECFVRRKMGDILICGAEFQNKNGTGASVLGEGLGGVEGEAGDFGALGEEADVVGVDVGEVVRDFVVD